MPDDERYWSALQEIGRNLAANTTATTACALSIRGIETELRFRPDLAPRVADLEKRIIDIEKAEATQAGRSDGGWKVWCLVCVTVAFVITTAVAWFRP